MSFNSLTLFLLLLSGVSLYGQQTIKGRVLDEDLEILPGVEIYGNDTVKLGVTNIKGYFEVSVPEEINKLTFGWLGYERTSISNYCNYIEIVLLYDVIYHYNSNRKVDRLRKRRFEKLPELHEKAYEKNLFNKRSACFQYKFIPIKPQLDKIKQQMKVQRRANRDYFKKLEIGDTIRVPFSCNRAKEADRTTLYVFSYVVDDEGFDCVIEGIIQDKNRKNNGHNLIYTVTSLSQCQYEALVHEGEKVTIGTVLDHNMKYFKVLIY